MELCHFFRQLFIFLITRNNVKGHFHPSNFMKQHRKSAWNPGAMPYAMSYAQIWRAEVVIRLSIR